MSTLFGFIHDVVADATVGARIYGEDLGVDGIASVFTTAFYFLPGTEQVLLNGVRLKEGTGCDYTRSESVPTNGYDTITLAFVPKIRTLPRTSDYLTIDYDPS